MSLLSSSLSDMTRTSGCGVMSSWSSMNMASLTRFYSTGWFALLVARLISVCVYHQLDMHCHVIVVRAFFVTWWTAYIVVVAIDFQVFIMGRILATVFTPCSCSVVSMSIFQWPWSAGCCASSSALLLWLLGSNERVSLSFIFVRLTLLLLLCTLLVPLFF